MSKAFMRIIYGILISLGLILTYNYTDSNLKQNYINKIGEEALATESYDTFVPNQFFNKNLLYDEIHEVAEMKLKVMLYEVVRVSFVKDEIKIDEGMFFLIHQLGGKPLDDYYAIKLTGAKNTKVEFLGIKITKLPVYTAIIADTASSFLNKDNFVKDDVYEVITSLEIYTEFVEEPILRIGLNITNERYQLKPIILDYYATNNKLPEAPIGNLRLAPIHIIDTVKWVMINMAIYMLVATVLTVFVFTFKKRTLGRKKPTIGVALDLEKIKKRDKKTQK